MHGLVDVIISNAQLQNIIYSVHIAYTQAVMNFKPSYYNMMTGYE